MTPRKPTELALVDANQLPRIPRRIVDITLPEPYDAFVVKAWVNFPASLRDDKRWPAEGDEGLDYSERYAKHFLMKVVLEHTFSELPPADDPAFWKDAPIELGPIIMEAVYGEIGHLPKPGGVRT